MKKLILIILVLFPSLISAQLSTYNNDFEGVQSFYTNAGSLWERGVPTMSRIDTAHGGINVWATDLDTNYDSANDTSYLFTPYFQTSGMDSINVSFWHYIDADSTYDGGSKMIDGGMVEYSTGNSNAWILLGYMGDPLSTNWYNDVHVGGHRWFYQNSGWMFSKYSLHLNGGVDSILFRFNFDIGVQPLYSHNNRNGWAIDDFNVDIFGPNYDVGVIKILSPSDTLTGLNNDMIIVRVKNFGGDPINISNIPYIISINGLITNVYPSSSGTLFSGDTADVLLSIQTPIQLGPLTFCVRTIQPADQDTSNDESCISLSIGNISNQKNKEFYLGQSIPNPANSIVKIPFSIPTKAIAKIQLVNLIGQKVYEKERNFQKGDNTFEININNLANGVYFYSLEYNGQKRANKLLIN